MNLDPLAAEPSGSAFTRYELARQSTGRELRQGGTVVMRADSAYYPAAFCGPVRRVGHRFSVMVQIDPKIAAAIG